ncbi:MAG: 2-oxo-4-hydroxy-4-carboxy-5-ureidoimidazoline decarboxylase [Jatrophihabitans sp.]
MSQLVHGRPYGRLEWLSARSDAILSGLDGPELAEALAAQAAHGLDAGMPDERRAYEQRFGHVFLLAATGLSTDAVRSTLRSRLRNDPVAEREIARGELSKIVRRRLAATFR